MCIVQPTPLISTILISQTVSVSFFIGVTATTVSAITSSSPTNSGTGSSLLRMIFSSFYTWLTNDSNSSQEPYLMTDKLHKQSLGAALNSPVFKLNITIWNLDDPSTALKTSLVVFKPHFYDIMAILLPKLLIERNNLKHWTKCTCSLQSYFGPSFASVHFAFAMTSNAVELDNNVSTCWRVPGEDRSVALTCIVLSSCHSW